MVRSIPLWELMVTNAWWMSWEMHADLRHGRAGDLRRYRPTFWGRRKATGTSSA